MVSRHVDRETAPSAADLQEMISWLKFQFPAQPVVLFHLGAFQLLVGFREERAGVGHRIVKKKLEEIVAEIVVLGNVLAASPDVVRAKFVIDPVEQFEEIAGNESLPGARNRRSILHVEQKPFDDRSDAVGLPVSVYIRLTESDVAVQRALPKKGFTHDSYRRLVGRIPVAKFVHVAVGENDPHEALCHSRQEAKDDPLVEGRALAF